MVATPKLISSITCIISSGINKIKQSDPRQSSGSLLMSHCFFLSENTRGLLAKVIVLSVC